MKSIMISIQPKWCEKIASGEKTIEVRKTRPKLETPFKCYIYCTNGNGTLNDTLMSSDRRFVLNQKVIGEFVCDNMLHSNENAFIGNKPLTQYVLKLSCLTMEEINQYRQGKNIYGWHISDLKIYDKPKSLEMFPVGKIARDCGCGGYIVYDKVLTRPPQSWCYIEK